MNLGLLRLLVRAYLPAAAAGAFIGFVWSQWLLGFLVLWLGGAVIVVVSAALAAPSSARATRRVNRYATARETAGSSS